MADQKREGEQRVLSIDPTSRGFGYAVLEGATRLIDWGTKDSGRADDSAALRDIGELLEHYCPDVVILEKTRETDSRRRHRARGLISAIGELAESRGIGNVSVSRRSVLHLFAGGRAINKRAIALAISNHFPELAPRVPPVRKAWMSEDARTSIFDAVAFALVFYFQFDEQDQERIGNPRR